MILPLLLLSLFLAGLLSLITGQSRSGLPKAISYGGMLLALFMMIVLGLGIFAEMSSSNGYVVQWFTPWVEAFGINLHLALALDSYWLCLLTLCLGLLAIFMSQPEKRAGGYYAALLWSIMGVLGIFLAADVFWFLIFWELSLIPVYYLMMVHGNKERIPATWRFIIYTQGSGLILLFSILALGIAHYQNSGELSFAYEKLSMNVLSLEWQRSLFIGFMLAFLIKLPAFPFHGWMPRVFTESPAAVIVGLLIKTSAFGILRFSWPLFPDASQEFAYPMMFIGAFSLLYGAIKAFGQREPKELLAYSSISHAGLLLVGAFAGHTAALYGVIALMIAQALSACGIFLLVHQLYGKDERLDLTRLGGLWQNSPQFSVLLLGFVLASIGLPGFANFIGEWLILWGVFFDHPAMALVTALGLIAGAVYSLWLFQRLCYGEEALAPIRIKTAHLTVYGFIMMILLALGFYPGLMFSAMHPSPFGKSTSIASLPDADK